MTILKQNRISMIAGTAILIIALAFGGFSFTSHSFEAGVAEGTIPDNTHIRLDGMTLPAGGVFPLYDASPNYVSGHFLLTSPCELVNGETGGDPERDLIMSENKANKSEKCRYTPIIKVLDCMLLFKSKPDESE